MEQQFPFAVDDAPANSSPPVPATANSVMFVPPPDQTENFAYITVTEDDDDEVDIWLDETATPALIAAPEKNRPTTNTETNNMSVLTLLWTDRTNVVEMTEQGHAAARLAAEAHARGDMRQALEKHGEAAQFFLEAAQQVRNQNDGALLSAFAGGLLVSCCLVLLIVTLDHSHSRHCFFSLVLVATLTKPLLLLSQSQAESAASLQRILKLPDTIRKVIARKHQPEADLSASTFLRSAPGRPTTQATTSSTTTPPASPTTNPLEEMLELERELRDMDMALAVSSSITSLDTRSRRAPNTIADSFLVVPSASTTFTNRPHHHRSTRGGVLDDDASVTTTATLHTTATHHHHNNNNPTNTSPQQVMQLMETIRRMGNENAALLRRVEQADADRHAAKSARAAMERFQREYSRRLALVQQQWRASATNTTQEELMRQLTVELQKEKEENRKKSVAIKKYEDFYRAVRARSAEKKKQQQLQEQQQRKTASSGSARAR